MRLPRHKGLGTAAFVLLLLTASYVGAGMDGIIFSHRFHVEDVGIGCTECHPEATHDGATPDERLPTRANCGSCHDVEDQSSCGVCHASEAETPRCVTIEGCAAFSHAQHTRMRPECSECHEGISCAENSAETFLPRTTICGECHLKQGITPGNHDLGWEHLHGREAELDTESCALCHLDQRECRECHAGDNLSGSGTPHPLAFLYSHGADARMERTRCSSCHSDELFCIECHAAYGTKPLSHDLGSWTAGGHGSAARRNLGQCMICHEESAAAQSCGGCHP